MKKIFVSFLTFLISIQLILSLNVVYAAVSPQIADFLCERGIAYYNLQKYDKALAEFKKARLANPESALVQEYINMIEAQNIPLVQKISSINFLLDKLEVKAENGTEVTVPFVAPDKETTPVVGVQRGISQAPQQLRSPETVIDIHAKEVEGDSFEINTNVGERLIMQGRNIQRFLITHPALLKATKRGADELIVEPQEIGTTYLHIWDDNGRQTFRYIIGPRRLEQELLRQVRERYRESILPQSFKATYYISGNSFYSGRGIGDQERQGHTYVYSSSVKGETPFGNFDSAVAGNRSQNGTYGVSNIRMGITGGHYDELKDINIRGFDFTPSFPAFGFPASDLRGVKLEAPMFEKKLRYMAFWGVIPSGGFTQLESSSGLRPTKDAWLEGLGVNYRLSKFANFKTFYAHSYGPDRSQPVVTSDVSGFGMNYHLGCFGLDSEFAYDHVGNISYTANTDLTWSKLRIGLSATDTNEHFASLFGGEAAGGATTRTLNLNYRPASNITISNSFSTNQDKVFGNPENPDRLNFNSSTSFSWLLDPHTEMELNYTLSDQKGSVVPSVTETKRVAFRKKIFFIRRLSLFLDYLNSKSKNYTSPAQDYNNNRIFAGINFRIIGELYAFYHRELNFLRNTFTDDTALPTAQEYGLNFYGQIFNTPFHINTRLYYRDEEDTSSVLSYLSGEDRLEGEAELSYKLNADNETFLKARITNVWAEREGTAKHFDVDINWGVRFLWDTGLRWEPTGGFQGYVFYDVNADGIRQRHEGGVKGVEVKGPQEITVTTDEKGYYKIPRVTGKKAMIELNLETIPKGYNATTSITREVEVVPAKSKRVDFGLATRSEISGLVFVDKNDNGVYDVGEEGLKGVVVILDDEKRTVTSVMGEYMFRRLSPGEHTFKIDLKSIPVKFVPKVQIVKKIKVLEGATFVYNIPLRIQETE